MRSQPLTLPAAKRQRLVDFTKVFLDIAKESSDACPPLKSCLGGINALIKHYDVRSPRTISSPSLTDYPQEIRDVKDKLEDLTPWVIKLKDSLTKAYAKDDREEVERRGQLEKSVSHLSHSATLN